MTEDNYIFPGIDLLNEGVLNQNQAAEEPDCSEKLVKVLAQYGIKAEVIDRIVGPTVTLYKVRSLGTGIATKLRKYEAEILFALSEGRQGARRAFLNDSIGFELPNVNQRTITLEEVLEQEGNDTAGMALPCTLGVSTDGNTLSFDLADSPNLLIAGATKQGKTRCMHSIICSLLYHKRPSELKLVLVDPKQVEFGVYEPLKDSFLVSPDADCAEGPIVCDYTRAVRTLNALCSEMNRRYGLLAAAEVKNIRQYNAKSQQTLPYIVTIIDEYADLVLLQDKRKREIDIPILSLAQKARAVGIHIILATQRTSGDVITGLVKAYFPARIALRVCSGKDSMTILDSKGAECLMGRGDMLFYAGVAMTRVQGAMVANDEIERIVSHIVNQNADEPPYVLFMDGEDKPSIGNGNSHDSRLRDAARLVVRRQRTSCSMLQMEFGIGYLQASRIMNQLENLGIVGEFKGKSPREVLVTDEEIICRILNTDCL